MSDPHGEVAAAGTLVGISSVTPRCTVGLEPVRMINTLPIMMEGGHYAHAKGAGMLKFLFKRPSFVDDYAKAKAYALSQIRSKSINEYQLMNKIRRKWGFSEERAAEIVHIAISEL